MLLANTADCLVDRINNAITALGEIDAILFIFIVIVEVEVEHGAQSPLSAKCRVDGRMIWTDGDGGAVRRSAEDTLVGKNTKIAGFALLFAKQKTRANDV